jgi:uncharacterized protein YfaQ (DUF2300 family)
VRTSIFASALLALSGAACSATGLTEGAGTVTGPGVAWLRDGRVESRAIAAHQAVPLGSLWKLFVFSYLSAANAREAAYTCSPRAAQDPEERYCCAPGETVARSSALARSCAPYFSPARLGISAAAWREHWRSHRGAPWLQDLARLQPATQIPLGELLHALESMPPEAKAEARAALLETALEGYGRESWTRLGTGIRYKTYSWHLSEGKPYGGAAGWLADGTPFWVGAPGSSRSVLSSWAPQIAATLPAPRLRAASAFAGDATCVDVDFFARYPVRAVWQAGAREAARSGELRGRYRVQFENGNGLPIVSDGELTLSTGHGSPVAVTGRFTLNDYVARVIDREGGGRPAEAARALAIAARTYLLQNARFEAGCWRIADSSRTQRVSPNPPSADALQAAWFTDELTLQGVAVRYHGEAPGRDRLAWREAVARAGEGWDFERILMQAYSRATFTTATGRQECARLAAAESWLASAAVRWQARLRTEPGYEPLSDTPRVCALADGHPYSDQQRLRIHVRGWLTHEERITLAHEYLHLAFRFHPNGADEGYIERLARRVAGG